MCVFTPVHGHEFGGQSARAFWTSRVWRAVVPRALLSRWSRIAVQLPRGHRLHAGPWYGRDRVDALVLHLPLLPNEPSTPRAQREASTRGGAVPVTRVYDMHFWRDSVRKRDGGAIAICLVAT